MSVFIHPTAIVDEGCQVGDGTKIWHFTHLMPGCVIGKNCTLGQNVMGASKVVIGDNVKIQNNVSLFEGVTCEDDVFIGPSAVFTNVINPRSTVSRKHEYRQTLVKKGATVGANATIICGNTIGEYAFIGAGAVVTKPVPAYALVIGNPAVHSGWMSEMGHKLDFDANGSAVCAESKHQYKLENNIVRKVV